SQHVVAVHTGAEPLQPRAARRGVQVLGEVELPAAAHADVEIRVAHEVDGRALERVREAGGRDEQKRARPPVAGMDEAVDQMEIQVTKRRLSLIPSSTRPKRVDVPRSRASCPSAESNTSDTTNSPKPMRFVQWSR